MATWFRGEIATAAIFLCILIVPTTAVAAPVITGTFAGTAVHSVLYQPFPPGPPTSFDGTPISGKFRLDLTNCYLDMHPGSPFAGGCEAQAPTYISGNYAHGAFEFADSVLATVTNTASSQNLLVEFSVGDPYNRAYLSLTGGLNAFVDGVNYATLHPGSFDLSTASIQLDGGRYYATGVALTSLRLDQVPEPAGWMSFATALGIVGVGFGGCRGRYGVRVPA